MKGMIRMKRFIYLSLSIFLVTVFVFCYGKIEQVIKNSDIAEISNDALLKTEEVEILKVVDGDTIIVKTSEGIEERVRLLLIDTPESVHPSKEKELFGKESSTYAKSVLKKGDTVTMEIGNPDRDAYDRLLAYIWINNDINFNQLMIEKGYARVAYIYPPNTKYLDEFMKSQEKAKKEKLNIWSIDGYVTDDGFDMSVVR